MKIYCKNCKWYLSTDISYFFNLWRYKGGWDSYASVGCNYYNPYRNPKYGKYGFNHKGEKEVNYNEKEIKKDMIKDGIENANNSPHVTLFGMYKCPLNKNFDCPYFE